ncbi:hypothetical protein AAE478_002638 [Parahypoxylon ruwenzoriense]
MASLSVNGTKMQLTPREIDVTAKAWLCITEIKNGIPQVDSKKLAKVGNYASADSARHIWKPIQKKLMAMATAAAATVNEEDESNPATPKKKSKGAPRKRKTEVDSNADDNDMVERTPTKKTRARRSTRATAKKVEEDDDDDDEISDINDALFSDGEA